jgi:hypothetical protein
MHSDRQALAAAPRRVELFAVRHELDAALDILLVMKDLRGDFDEVE